jgi:hypothetical protein
MTVSGPRFEPRISWKWRRSTTHSIIFMWTVHSQDNDDGNDDDDNNNNFSLWALLFKRNLSDIDIITTKISDKLLFNCYCYYYCNNVKFLFNYYYNNNIKQISLEEICPQGKIKSIHHNRRNNHKPTWDTVIKSRMCVCSHRQLLGSCPGKDFPYLY